MGSSEAGSVAVDCSVGSIVWVRRRNGSWWPGKILGSDELSATHLMSPRSGTPVKLLGREDASVDWYNLERSKRVKAFRCGEFDECILRAEASLGMPPKKREKYARREDAILHALELERQLLEKKYGNIGYSNGERSESPDVAGKGLVISSEYLENGGAKDSYPKSSLVSGKHDFPFEEDKTGHHLYTGKAKEVYRLKGDNDSFGALPLVRGLQESGLMAVPLERNLPSSDASNGSLDPFSDNTAHFSPSAGPSTEVMVDANSDSLFKRRDKHRPLVQVLQNSAKISHFQPNVDTTITMSRGEQEDSACRAKRSRYTYQTTESGNCLNDKRVHPNQIEIPTSKLHQDSPADLHEKETSDSAEDTETDSSETETTESDSDEDMSALSDGAASIGLEPKYPGRMGLYAEHGSASSEELDELALTDDISNAYYDNPVSASEGVSKWQLKGKRNNRSFMNRYLDGTDRKLSGGSIYGTYFTEKGSNGCDESDLIQKSVRTRIIGYGSRGSDGVNHDISNWENLALNEQPAIKGYWEDSEECFSPAYAGQRHIDGRSMLIDVDLKVQASYQRPHVPLISLTSKVNGHAIVGHPIQIEYLENSSAETLLAAADDFYPEMSDYSTALAPVWRTARRTANSRVPRSHPSSALDNDENSMNVQVGVYQDGKVPNAGTSGLKPSMMKNSIANSQLDRRFSRKQPKRISPSCNQKMRTLSSIASPQRQSNDLKRSGDNYQASALMKPDSVPTPVACIPVKLVFSRLQEELVGRHQ